MAKTLIQSFDATTPGMKLCVTCKKRAREEHARILAQNEQSSSTSETDESEFVNTNNETAFEDLNSDLFFKSKIYHQLNFMLSHNIKKSNKQNRS